MPLLSAPAQPDWPRRGPSPGPGEGSWFWRPGRASGGASSPSAHEARPRPWSSELSSSMAVRRRFFVCCAISAWKLRRFRPRDGRGLERGSAPTRAHGKRWGRCLTPLSPEPGTFLLRKPLRRCVFRPRSWPRRSALSGAITRRESQGSAPTIWPSSSAWPRPPQSGGITA